MQPIYTKIIAWLDDLTPSGCKVIVRDQNAPAPAPPFVTVKITPVRDIARDFASGVDENGDLDVVRFIALTADVQVFGSSIFEAETIANGIADYAYNTVNNLDILGRSLAFQLIRSGPQSMDTVIGSEFEPRAVMAIGFSAARDLVYQVGTIETVIWEGEVDQETIGDEVTYVDQPD